MSVVVDHRHHLEGRLNLQDALTDAHNLEDETKGKSKAASDVEACGRVLEILVLTYDELKRPAKVTGKDNVKGSKWEEFQILACDRLYKATVPLYTLFLALMFGIHVNMAVAACMLRSRRSSPVLLAAFVTPGVTTGVCAIASIASDVHAQILANAT